MKDFLTDEEFEQLPDAPDMLSDEQFESLPDVEQAPVEQFESPETGLIEAGIRGAVQGLTFDYGDEIGALAESAFTGKPYDRALEESRAEYKLAKEEYPVTSLIGGIAGGVGQAAAISTLTGGAGAALPAGRLKKAVESIRALYLPTADKSALKNIASAAKTGAIMSGITATGASEKEGVQRLTEIPEAATMGALTGGVLGGAVEGIKKGASAAGKKLTEMAEEGDLPYSFIKAMDVIKAGKEGKGYITRKSMEAVDQNLMDSAEEGVEIVQTALDDVRNLKSTMLKNVPVRIPIQTPLLELQKNLENQVANNLMDAEPALKAITRRLSNLDLDDAGNTAAFSVNNIINELDDYIFSQKELSSEVKRAFKNASNDLKLRLRSSVSSEDALAALRQTPEYMDIYKKYISSIPDEELANSEILAKQEQEQLKKWMTGMKSSLTKSKKKMTPEEAKALQKEQNLALGSLKRIKKEPESIESAINRLPEEDVNLIREEINNILEQKAAINPLGQMDSIMHNILNASENLGKVTRGQGTELSRKFKLFDVMRGSSSDTGTGQKALVKYNTALKDLAKANPDLAKQFEKKLSPSILDMENKKFLQGAKLGEESKEGGLQTIVTAPAKIAGITGNIIAQTSGKVTSPGLAGMISTKNKIDDNLKVNPDSALLKFFSKGLETAINQKDESRRAAILNTLSQYKTFRQLSEEEE